MYSFVVSYGFCFFLVKNQHSIHLISDILLQIRGLGLLVVFGFLQHCPNKPLFGKQGLQTIMF